MKKAGRLNLQKSERDVSEKGQPERSILKKTGADSKSRSPDQQLLYNKIEPNVVINTKVGEQLLGQKTLKKNQEEEIIAPEGHGGHVQIQETRFAQYLAGQKKLAYELGEQKRAIKNLQFSLQERISLYDTTDSKIWRLCEAQSEIALNFAIQMIRLKKSEEAADYLAIARKALEPLPGSEWSERHEWHVLRRDLFKNIAIFHQGQDEWQKAFDNLRIVISHERRIGDNTANSSLTCGILLSKMNRFAESIEFAQESCNEVEKALGISHNKPLHEYRYQGKNREQMEEKDKQFTTYAIANHLVAKALLNLQYFKEARYFLQKASTACTKCLNVPKKELSIAISNDMAKVTQVSRGNLKNLTEQQVKSSLVTIKTDLATRAMSGIGGDRIEQRTVLKALEEQREQELQQEEGGGGVLRFADQEEDKPVSPLPEKRIKSKDKKSSSHKSSSQQPTPTKPQSDEKAKKVRRVTDEDIERQRQRSKSREKPKEEKKDNTEFLDINKYEKLATNLKRNNQRLYNEDQAQEKKEKEQAKKEQKNEQQSPHLSSKKTGRSASEKPQQTGRNASEKVVSQKQSSREKTATEKLDALQGKKEKKRRLNSQNVKKQSVNLAADGAEQDPEGVKYSHERSVKSYLRARKQQIRELNKELGYSESDQSMTKPSKPQQQRERRQYSDEEESPEVKRSPNKLPPVQKNRSVSRSQAVARGMNAGEDQVKQGGRREFIAKKINQGSNQNVENVLQQLSQGMKIKKESEEREKTPTASEPSEADEADDLNARLNTQVQKKVQIQQDNNKIGQLDSIEDKEVKEALDLFENIPVSDGEQDIHNLVDVPSTQVKQLGAQSSSKGKKEQTKTTIVNGQIKETPITVKSKSPHKSNLSTRGKRKKQQPVEEMPPLKRQGTPPLKKDREEAQRAKLIEKHQQTKQPSQKQATSVREALRGQKNDDNSSKRQTLLYQLRKEKKLNTGDVGRGKAEKNSYIKLEGQNQTKNQTSKSGSKKSPNKTSDDEAVGFGPMRPKINQFRLNELSMPKKAQSKQMTDEEFQRKAQKQAEIESRRANYKKFDFEYYVDRDRDYVPQDHSSFQEMRQEFNQVYKAGDRIKQKQKQRQRERSPDDQSFEREAEISPNNIAAIVKKISGVNETEIPTDNDSHPPLNIKTENGRQINSQRNLLKPSNNNQANFSPNSQLPHPASSPDNISQQKKSINARKKMKNMLPPRDSRTDFRTDNSDSVNPHLNRNSSEKMKKIGSSKALVGTRQSQQNLDDLSRQISNNRSLKSQSPTGQQVSSPESVSKNKKRMNLGDVTVSQSNSTPNPFANSIHRQDSRGRKGKAPSNQQVRQKSNMSAVEQQKMGIRNPFMSYGTSNQQPASSDHYEDSEIIADRKQKEQVSSLKMLRKLENFNAIKIQSLIRRFLTRKWYVNFLVRTRLGVPFSGLEFAQNPFLRQFNRLNRKMAGGTTEAIEIVNSQKADWKRNLVVRRYEKPQVKIDLTGGNREREIEERRKVVDDLKAGQDGYDVYGEEVPAVLEGVKEQPTRKITQMATPAELIAQLKNDFIDRGMDAYEQFKKMGVGVDFDAQGKAYAEGGIQKVRKMIEEQKIARLEFIGPRKLLEKDENADIDCQKVEVIETNEYQNALEERKTHKQDKTKATVNSMSNNMREILYNMQPEAKQDPPIIDQYQKLSREPIVFYKNMGYSDMQVKWNIQAGKAFFQNTDLTQQAKLFIPVTIIGKPLKARSTIISYTMNLELLQITRQATAKYEFETIWPYILYLFNNWVKHQVTLMGIKRILPGMQDRLPDSNYTIFECHNDLRNDFDALEDEAYNDMLNFSSELEVDPRFDDEELHEPIQIDRSAPEKDLNNPQLRSRKTFKESAQIKRKKLFDEYKNSVAKAIDMQEKQLDVQGKGRRFVQFADQLIDNLTVEEQMKLLGDDVLAQEKSFPMNQRDVDAFRAFLQDNFIRLPKPESNQIKLMAAMAQSVYWLMEKKGGLPRLQIALMNEERRRIRNLPALTQLDYNCIDRAAIKLRLILDCLQVERRMSGRALVPRNLKQQQKINIFQRNTESMIELCVRKDNLSHQLLSILGKMLQYGPSHDQQTVAVRELNQRVQQQRQQLQQIPRFADQEQEAQGPLTDLDNELLNNQEPFTDNQIGINNLQVRGGQQQWFSQKAGQEQTNQKGQNSWFNQKGQSEQANQQNNNQKNQGNWFGQVQRGTNKDESSPQLNNQQQNQGNWFNSRGQQNTNNQANQPNWFNQGRAADQAQSNQPNLFGSIADSAQTQPNNPNWFNARIDTMPMDPSQLHQQTDDGLIDMLNGQEQQESEQIMIQNQIQPPEDPNEFKQRIFLEKTEIEGVLTDDQIIEQGTCRFEGQIYLASIVYKMIGCNLNNMTILQQIKQQKYEKETKKFPLFQLAGPPKIDLVERGAKQERLRPKPCTFASHHPSVQEADKDFMLHHQLEGNKLLDLELIMANLVWTHYSSYIEIKMCPRLTSTTWVDSVTVTWEQLSSFFEFFGILDWEPNLFLKLQRFNQRESLIFYSFFPECLAVNEADSVTLTFSLARLNPIRHRYDMIFLNLHRFEWTQRFNQVNYFFPDALVNRKFDQCQFDELIYPYLQDPIQTPTRLDLVQTQDKLDNQKKLVNWTVNNQKAGSWFLGTLSSRAITNKLEMQEQSKFTEGQKPDILLDDATVDILKDPACLFNLDLEHFPRHKTLFIGTTNLKPVRSDFKIPFTLTTATRHNKAIQTTKTPTKFNVRIDYYVKGTLPCLQIRAWTQLSAQGGSSSQCLNMTTNNQKVIKDLIRICGQTSQQMVYNQLQSMFATESSTTGKRLLINHSVTRQKRIEAQAQDLFSMLVLNESLLAQRLGPHNTYKYKGIINLRSVSQGMSSVLASVNQYDIQQELLMQHGDLMIELMHGNKHITNQMIQKTRELILQKTLEEDPQSKLKEFKPLSLWKISVLDMRKSLKHDAILTQEDLTYFFESEIFKFFREHPDMQVPNILTLLHEYLLNLYCIRTPVGTTLAWLLQEYKPQLDENGVHIEIKEDQAYRYPKLQVYQHFLSIRQQQNAFQDANKLPFSLDQDKKARMNGKIPKLCLRTRLCIERCLPINETHDLRSLKYSSREYQIIVQVTRLFKDISQYHFCIITVTKHDAFEAWIWTLYFPLTQRTFTVTFFLSDIAALDSRIFRKMSDNESAASFWTKIVNATKIEFNEMRDITLKVDSFSESIKELLYQSYLYNESSKDFFFIEVIVRPYGNYVVDMLKAFPSINLADESQVKDYKVQLRAYSMAKEQWIKDYQPLGEVIALLKQDGIQWKSEETDEQGRLISKSTGVDPDELMEVSRKATHFYYSMIRSAAVLMANKITFAQRPEQKSEVKKRKMTYDLQQILKAKKHPESQLDKDRVPLRGDFVNMQALNKVIYQATVALNPIQVCSISYNESKDRFIYRLYSPFSGSQSQERRFDGNEIAKTCCPQYQTMLQNGMDKELGQRIAKFYHANILVASVLSIHKLAGLVEAFPQLNPEQSNT